MKFEKPFVITLAAPRRSGKTYFVAELIKKKFVKEFDHIIVMSQSAHSESYDSLRWLDKVSISSCVSREKIAQLINDQEQCMMLIAQQRIAKMKHKSPIEPDNVNRDIEHLPKEFVCPHTLLFLDDVIDSGVIAWGGEPDIIAARGRHFNMSVIVSSQKITSISPTIRMNSDYFIIFNPFAVREIEKFLEEFICTDMKTVFRKKLRDMFREKYNAIILDNNETEWGKRFKVGKIQNVIQDTMRVIFNE